MGILQKKELDVEQQTSVNNVVAAVLGTGPDIGFIPAIKFGREKEDEARKAYTREHEKCHRHPVNVSQCGLHVHEDYFFLSASPDGLVECECGQGLVEIKCPKSSFGKSPSNNLPFLHVNEQGCLQLKRSHACVLHSVSATTWRNWEIVL